MVILRDWCFMGDYLVDLIDWIEPFLLKTEVVL